jgi:small subunit ribosomal protein S24e
MEITVVDEEENPMLHRTDVTFRVSHVEATPDRLAVRDSLAARLNKDADEVVIRKLDTKFGMRTTYGEAKVYESPAFAQDVEQDYVLERNKVAAGAAGEAAVEAESADEPPAEPAEDEAPADEPEEPEAPDEESEEAETSDEEPEEAEPSADESADVDASADEPTSDEAADEETEE